MATLYDLEKIAQREQWNDAERPNIRQVLEDGIHSTACSEMAADL
ncbi:MAG TPA: hypothetical protein PLA50_10175 [Bacteroidia bacterium]|nr:hypothetical protein [Bacteroidia bacterium]